MIKLRNILLFFILAITLTYAASAGEPDLVQYANTLQGTHSDFGLSRGNTYPMTALPFGMHGWSPQTGKNGDGWKYKFSDNTIRGFQQVHQCSPWVGDYAVFSLMPVSGSLIVDENKRAAGFEHKNETGLPNYYRVKFNNGNTAEISPTERGGHLRFTFSQERDNYIILDGYTKMSMVKIIPSEKKIIGYVHNGAFVPKSLKSYFIIQFDQPFEDYGTWENKGNTINKGNLTDEGPGVGAYVKFGKGVRVSVKTASSYISPEQAEINFEREVGKNKTFEQTKGQAAKVWNKLFGRVLVSGGTLDQKKTFYSCLFRANLFSRKFFEYNKDGLPYYYSPYDEKVHNGYMYTDNGFWDTFRTQFPLNNILHRTQQGQYMQALLDAQEQCGWLPAWSFPSETGGMLGNHAISLLTDAWMKGIRTFNPEKALIAYAHEAMNKGPWGGANGRAGWKEYWQLGYVSFPESQGSTAQTLEYAYDDFCGYQLARVTGNKFYENIFARQMYNYRNVFDSLTGFMRGRKTDGSWVEPFDSYEWGGPYTEGNAWHYTWSVFHDIQGYINLLGSDEKFLAKLDSVFSTSSKVVYGSYGHEIHEMKEMVLANMGQYAQGNQPIQHMIYLYNYAGQPWKAQYHVRQVLDRLYHWNEDGYPGDEDQGGMSSWYILSALGLYAVCPGTDEYVIGSPLFPKVEITLENGKKFVIEAEDNSPENCYIQSALLNGAPITRNFIKFNEIESGGLLKFRMGNKPNESRGTKIEDRPFSLSKRPTSN
jgi:predicted alpha-1,2-mannosidase